MKGKHILVVEDDPKSLYALKEVLEARGASVFPAASGEDALAFAPQDYDTAIIDIRLPGIPGAELARRLRRSVPAMRIIFVTAYDGVHEVQELFPDSKVLVKPLNLQTILSLLNDATRDGK